MSSMTSTEIGLVLVDDAMALRFEHPSVQHIVRNMRFSDRVEVHLSHRMSRSQAVRESMASSTHLALIVDPSLPEQKEGEPWLPLAIGGISEPIDGARLIWMLGHELLDREMRYPKKRMGFATCTLAAVEHWKECGDPLHNWCHAANERTLRWLPWLGFTVGDPEPIGENQAPFCHFWMDP